MAASMLGCGENISHTKNYKYPNESGTADIVLKIDNVGGSAGFVINTVYLESGNSKESILISNHLSEFSAKWINNSTVEICFYGTIEEDNSGIKTVNKHEYIVQITDDCNSRDNE